MQDFEQSASSASAAPRGAIELRCAEFDEIGQLALLWHAGWQDAHADLLPAELARHRTVESLHQRLRDGLAYLRVAGLPGAAIGLCMIKDAELYQLYVAGKARGTGVAAALLADGEERIARTGARTAWLACAIGNERAARFYEKNGWRRVGKMINELDTPDGIFRLEVWRYEKALVSLSS